MFDPELSLTGDCSESPLDPVQDPGLCPIPPGTTFIPGGSQADHPSAAFSNPGSVATDAYGNLYVGSAGPPQTSGVEGRIDIFDPKGRFITEVADALGPGAMALDNDGNLYVANRFGDVKGKHVVRYEPTGVYDPAERKIEYTDPPSVVVENALMNPVGIAIDRTDGRLFVTEFSSSTRHVSIYTSATEGNAKEVGEEFAFGADGLGVAVDSAQGRVFVSVPEGPASERVNTVQAYDLASPHSHLYTINGSEVPGGKFTNGSLALAIDEGSGHLFVYDSGAKKVQAFETSDSGASYLKAIVHGLDPTPNSTIAVDNGPFSPNGAMLDSEGERYLFVPSHPASVGHSFAFGPPEEGKPEVESVSFSSIGETEAELHATIEPNGLKTHYTFEYITQQQFDEQGKSFTGAQVAGEGDIAASKAPVDVAASLTGLQPGTAYRFQVIAENELGEDEAQSEFSTYPEEGPSPVCSNASLRSGFSALLPDCRAYELVTPANTNGHPIIGLPRALAPGLSFATRTASPAGEAVSFLVEGGAIPGFEGASSLLGDPYLASRGEASWSTAAAGPSGAEAFAVQPGSVSPDQGYSFWGGNGGSLMQAPGTNNFLRHPDGKSELIGHGSLGEDPGATGLLIGEGGGHVLFASSAHLEPDAPEAGTQALYDRSANGVTHLVSLLPGEVTPSAGQGAIYVGAALDGKGVAFKISNTLYLRYDNEETFELSEAVTFAGSAGGGAKVFYLEGGKLWRFDALTEERTEFSSGPVTPVNVAADGNVAYFVSQSVFTSEPNPNGAVAKGGEENLYRSEEGAISFVGTVTERDVEGESNGNELIGGIGLWTEKVGPGRLAADPSRTTPDGDALLFESRAVLDGYDPEGKAEVYRYDFTGNELDCLSCNPTLAPASSDASLQSISAGWGQDNLPLQGNADIKNLHPNGNRAFFQSDEALVPADIDGLQDVYEWEARGVGSCARPGGCVYLISSGASAGSDYLYAAGDNGDDVFIHTPDLLLPAQDPDETPSIYDARVDGGFPGNTGTLPECLSEPCPPPPPPARSPLASSVFEGAGNVTPKKRCRKARRARKRRCTRHRKHHYHHHRHPKPSTKGRAGR